MEKNKVNKELLNSIPDINWQELKENTIKTTTLEERINYANYVDDIIFPSQKYSIIVYTFDLDLPEIPHFHIKTIDGWDIVFDCENINVIKILSKGDNKTFNYINKNIKKWLKQKDSFAEHKTKKELIKEMWISENYWKELGII